MSEPATPFPVPARLSADLERISRYWQDLRRAGNAMPFWDDVNLSALPDVSDRTMLVEVLDGPPRFRFNIVGRQIAERYGESLDGQLADEVEPKSPLEYFSSQASATLEARAPTFYRAGIEPRPASGYSRIVLPLWGDGEIRNLLVGIDFADH